VAPACGGVNTVADGGMARNERGNLANAKERGEHEHQWLT
jgi:hypothetical protein